jgi:hypothetical protein
MNVNYGMLFVRIINLPPFLYECFYNILTICSTFNVGTIIDMMLRWHHNDVSWNGIDIMPKHLTSHEYWINDKNMTNISTTYINELSNWWLYVEDSMVMWSLIQYVDGIITICIELALGLFWHNLHFFDMHSMGKILSNRKGKGKGGWQSHSCAKKQLFINWIPMLNGWRNQHNLSLVQEHKWKKS